MQSNKITLSCMRCFDLGLSICAIVVLLPLFLTVIVILRFTGEREVIYRQTRLGRFNKTFQLIKFATMLKDSPSIGSGELTLPADARVLPVGKILRKTKINELPQLFNILRGDLSFVGPRPQTKKFFECFDVEDAKIIATIRPGLSGIGSLIFRDEEEIFKTVEDPQYWDEKVIMPFKGRLECWYIKNMSMKNYFLLIAATVASVLFPKRIKAANIFNDLPLPSKELEFKLRELI